MARSSRRKGVSLLNAPLSQGSAVEYNQISSGEMTPSMAARYLRDEQVPLRGFGDTLREMYPYPDLQPRLIRAFSEEEAASASAARKVYNWLSGACRPVDREDVFRIAFALELSEAQASVLLGLCTDYGIHYREGRDLIYAWFLRHNLSYREARDFFRTLPTPPHDKEPPPIDPATVTHGLQNTFALIQTREELRERYIASLPLMGSLHLRAYHYFQRYMDHLIHPAPGWTDPEAEYSLDAVMDRYLSLHMPSGKKRAGYTPSQKLIKRNWPNTTALKNIRAQREDVPRKLLLLLYVITENVTDGEYTELDEDYLTLEERLDDHWWIINAMLIDCGMPVLDPRSAFDWLVLYALTATGDESMGERMERVIEELYADVK